MYHEWVWNFTKYFSLYSELIMLFFSFLLLLWSIILFQYIFLTFFSPEIPITQALSFFILSAAVGCSALVFFHLFSLHISSLGNLYWLIFKYTDFFLICVKSPISLSKAFDISYYHVFHCCDFHLTIIVSIFMEIPFYSHMLPTYPAGAFNLLLIVI